MSRLVLSLVLVGLAGCLHEPNEAEFFLKNRSDEPITGTLRLDAPNGTRLVQSGFNLTSGAEQMVRVMRVAEGPYRLEIGGTGGGHSSFLVSSTMDSEGCRDLLVVRWWFGFNATLPSLDLDRTNCAV